jgi:hypothetical protein
MDETDIYLLLGAGGGLVATFFLLTLKDLWLQDVLPLWRRWRYRGETISGEWTGLGNASTPVAGEWTEITLRLQQHTRDVHGLLWIRRCSAGRCVELKVSLAGKISDGYVTLGPSDIDAAALPATALLKIQGRGSSLNGHLVYRDAQTDVLEGIHMSVHRAESRALPRLRPIVAEAAGA